MWKISGFANKGDYIYAIVHNHPNATIHGYVLYHRILMENKIGRVLKRKEVVHHINGNKKDNRIENLELMDIKEHGKRHAKIGRKFVRLKCPGCGKLFDKEKKNTFLINDTTFTACSRKCRGIFSTNHNKEDVLIKMKENFVYEFIMMEKNNNE